MKKLWKSMIAAMLVLCMLVTTASGATATKEVYVSDLRLIYAQDFTQAKQILAESGLTGYQVLNQNLNRDTKKIGTWIAYKTTTNVEDAITDMAIMQMNGGYNEGNYQEMLKQSYAEYEKLGNTYLQAIDYFTKAYDADHFLAKSAYRQLNFYCVKTDPQLPKEKMTRFEGELLGDIFYNGITSTELATLFMEGNTYVLDNLRSLLAMGVAYNADGKHYLQKVAEEAAKMTANPAVFDKEDYEETASIVAGTVLSFGEMFRELAAYEDELDYTDETVTDNELAYAEYQSIADRAREVTYLNGQTFYDFCLGYRAEEDTLSQLFPLVAALNEGQLAMTQVAHYYDVVRYSMSDFPEEQLNQKISEQEAIYSQAPFNIFAGVDRSIYSGTYALTAEAYRADAYTESGFADYLTSGYGILGITGAVIAPAGLSLSIWAICRGVKSHMMTSAANKAVVAAQNAYNAGMAKIAEAVSGKTLLQITPLFSYNNTLELAGGYAFNGSTTCNEFVGALFTKMFPQMKSTVDFGTQLAMVQSGSATAKFTLGTWDKFVLDNINLTGYNQMRELNVVKLKNALDQAKTLSEETAQLTSGMTGTTIALSIAGGLMLLYSAITLGISIHHYYNPDYDDIPVAMVDLLNTSDGDRYIKYDVVYEAKSDKNGNLIAGDLNAFEGKRWNALYYTKSYEAGKPLLANFAVSNTSHTPAAKYVPVHRFGEKICYNLNKYAYNETRSIYLSVKQGEGEKAAVADLPQVVGSLFNEGTLLIAAGVGALFGIGGTLATVSWRKKKKDDPTEEGEVPQEQIQPETEDQNQSETEDQE
ncbi:MAG: hypothetical protein IKT68_00940 [Clostridia bacterium]|nr:hypothetical protein [Clostridia bacterium]